MTILLGALIIGGVVGVVGIKMQPNYDESRLQPIIVDPNEKFVGYVDGQYRAQSRQQASAPQASLARDAAFTRLVAPLTSPAEGRYHHPDIGEVLYVAVPVTLSGIRHGAS